MAKQKEVSVDTLNSLEKASVNKFLNESYKLYMSAGVKVDFNVWIDLLTEGLHEALLLQLKGKSS